MSTFMRFAGWEGPFSEGRAEFGAKKGPAKLLRALQKAKLSSFEAKVAFFEAGAAAKNTVNVLALFRCTLSIWPICSNAVKTSYAET